MGSANRHRPSMTSCLMTNGENFAVASLLAIVVVAARVPATKKHKICCQTSTFSLTATNGWVMGKGRGWGRFNNSDVGLRAGVGGGNDRLYPHSS